MNNVSMFTECAACGACNNICPVNAIAVLKDSEYYKIRIDSKKCIECGKCIDVCPWNTEEHRQNFTAAYGGWINDKAVVEKSSSGGLFSAVANWVLAKNGIVFGAVYSENMREVVFGSSDEYNLDSIRRSKYVESYVGNTFSEIKKILDSGRYVLYCAAPCQVAGLLRYLGKNYDTLLTCDFACGGLSSHKIYDIYLNELENRYRSKVCNVNFREKIFGWGNHGISVRFQNGKIYTQHAKLDPYFFSFVYGHLSTRDNCLNCKFKNNHYSDLVLADFWRYGDLSSLKKNYQGISLVLVNSDKGQAVMDDISSEITVEKLEVYKASYNCRTKSDNSDEIIEKRKYFMNCAVKDGLTVAAARCGMPVGKRALRLKQKARILKILHRIGVR